MLGACLILTSDSRVKMRTGRIIAAGRGIIAIKSVGVGTKGADEVEEEGGGREKPAAVFLVYASLEKQTLSFTF